MNPMPWWVADIASIVGIEFIAWGLFSPEVFWPYLAILIAFVGVVAVVADARRNQRAESPTPVTRQSSTFSGEGIEVFAEDVDSTADHVVEGDRAKARTRRVKHRPGGIGNDAQATPPPARETGVAASSGFLRRFWFWIGGQGR